MAQQPNIELDISDLPRPVPHPAPARRWRPARPGDLSGPDDLPTGSSFGATGPDGGYALRLAGRLELRLAEGESSRAAVAAIAALGSARAARAGRAPTPEDVEAGALILGYLPAGSEPADEGAARRRPLVAHIEHSAAKARALVASVGDEVLRASPDEIRARLEAGDRLFG